MTAYDPQKDPIRNYEGISWFLRVVLFIGAVLLFLCIAWLITGQPTACEQLGDCVKHSEVYR